MICVWAAMTRRRRGEDSMGKKPGDDPMMSGCQPGEERPGKDMCWPTKPCVLILAVNRSRVLISSLFSTIVTEAPCWTTVSASRPSHRCASQCSYAVCPVDNPDPPCWTPADRRSNLTPDLSTIFTHQRRRSNACTSRNLSFNTTSTGWNRLECAPAVNTASWEDRITHSQQTTCASPIGDNTHLQ